MCAEFIDRFLYPDLLPDSFIRTGGPKVMIAVVMAGALICAPIGGVTASAMVWIVNRKRRRVMQLMMRTHACFECGYSLQRNSGSCAECGSQPIFQVQLLSPAPSVSVFRMRAPEFTSLFRSLRCGKLHQHSLLVVRVLLTALLFIAGACFLLLGLVANRPLHAGLIFGLTCPLIFLGFLTVKHLELRPTRVLSSS